MSSTLPTRLGRYNVLGRLAAGGMAEILLAKLQGPAEVERPVVIKRILPHLAEDRTFVEMFLNEAHIVAGIRHPRVVQLQELVSDRGRGPSGEGPECGGELFLVLEYVEGESLGGLMRRMWTRGEALPYWLAAHIVAEACAGLHAAHELTAPDGTPRHVVHRDVSPQNVMITYSGDVKILDFGIAKARDRASKTEAGEVKGKIEYMSPEQCKGEPLDRRSDVFALGILLYELSVGRRLFRRDTMLTTFSAICDAQVPSPREVHADYPEDLEFICRRALAKRPADRYRTANDMRRELVAAARKLSGDEVAEDALTHLLGHLFADRIAEKREMLHRLRASGDAGSVPAAEVDKTVEIPSVIATTTDSERTPTSRSAHVLVAAALAVLASAIAFFAMTRSRETPAHVEPRPPEPPPALVSTSASIAAPPPAIPAAIQLSIETTPKGATVVAAGQPRGVTPLTIELPRGAEPVVVEIASKGYVKLVERVTPNADQKLVLHLQRAKTSGGAKAAPAGTASIARFD